MNFEGKARRDQHTAHSKALQAAKAIFQIITAYPDGICKYAVDGMIPVCSNLIFLSEFPELLNCVINKGCDSSIDLTKGL